MVIISNNKPMLNSTKRFILPGRQKILLLFQIQFVSNPKAKQDCQMVYENNTERPVEFAI